MIIMEKKILFFEAVSKIMIKCLKTKNRSSYGQIAASLSEFEVFNSVWGSVVILVKRWFLKSNWSLSLLSLTSLLFKST